MLSNYTFIFTPNDALNTGGIIISIPTNSINSTNSITSCSYCVNNILNYNTVNNTFSCSLNQALNANTSITLSINNIQNPISPLPLTINISTY
jgi:hypothetical protein